MELKRNVEDNTFNIRAKNKKNKRVLIKYSLIFIYISNYLKGLKIELSPCTSPTALEIFLA